MALPEPNPTTNETAERKSVLNQVADRTRNRRRRRGQPPRWVVWLATHLPKAGTFVRQTLPAFLVQNRDRIFTVGITLLIHIIVLMLLGFIPMPELSGETVMSIFAKMDNADELDDIELIDVPVMPEKLLNLESNSVMKQAISEMEDGIMSDQLDSLLERDITLPIDDLSPDLDIPVNLGELGGRSAAGKQAAIRKFGGNAESEKSVNSGLRWLASIQREDGSWSFDDVGDSRSPGALRNAQMGATSMSLLCFLGAGHTHRSDGPYKEVVGKGLAWIYKNAQRSGGTADLRGRSEANAPMYVHGITTICLCEAAAMEPDDKELRRLALEAINFIERAQDPTGGGWRYSPREAGDTSVTGWQLMALQSAKAGRIKFSSQTIRDAREFLNSVSAEKGSRYGYMEPSNSNPTMTAVALLCRMYMGWKRDHPGLIEGVKYLDQVGPSRENIYYNYYATQVLHHWGGDEWNRWNERMRTHLVETQVQNGPAAGSWEVTDPHGNLGGRIYQTTLSILTLEVYYRHLPIYRKLDAVEQQPDADAAVGR